MQQWPWNHCRQENLLTLTPPYLDLPQNSRSVLHRSTVTHHSTKTHRKMTYRMVHKALRNQHWSHLDSGCRRCTSLGLHSKQETDCGSRTVVGCGRGREGGGRHNASVSDCLPLAVPIGLSPFVILTLGPWDAGRSGGAATMASDKTSAKRMLSKHNRIDSKTTDWSATHFPQRALYWAIECTFSLKPAAKHLLVA